MNIYCHVPHETFPFFRSEQKSISKLLFYLNSKTIHFQLRHKIFFWNYKIFENSRKYPPPPRTHTHRNVTSVTETWYHVKIDKDGKISRIRRFFPWIVFCKNGKKITPFILKDLHWVLHSDDGFKLTLLASVVNEVEHRYCETSRQNFPRLSWQNYSVVGASWSMELGKNNHQLTKCVSYGWSHCTCEFS